MNTANHASLRTVVRTHDGLPCVEVLPAGTVTITVRLECLAEKVNALLAKAGDLLKVDKWFFPYPEGYEDRHGR